MTGKKLRKIREERGYTLEAFADLLGYSYSQMQRMEVGHRYDGNAVDVSRRVISFLKAKGWIHEKGSHGRKKRAKF